MSFFDCPPPAFTRRRLLKCALGGVATLTLSPLARAKAWESSSPLQEYIGDATISSEGLSLTLPLVAEDGSAVPLTIRSDLKAAASPIERLAIFAPDNPTPKIAEYEFGPNIDQLNMSTRIRLNGSQTVVAIAHTRDGDVIVAERDVRVTQSGCVAPAQASDSNEMTARVRLPKNWSHDVPGEIVTMITHPMITGLAMDSSGNVPPQRIVKSFTATLNGQPVITATYYRSLSINPYLRFDMTAHEDGELRFEWTEDTGRQVDHSEMVQLG